MNYKDNLLSRLMENTDPTRVSEAAPEDRQDGLADGFNIPLDAQARALSSRVKMPVARRIVALFSMAGVPGRYLAGEDAEGGILAATDMLRKKVSTRKAFIDFYSALATANGFAVEKSAPAVEEAEENKKGNYIQKLFTTVLISLGLPENLAGVTAPGAVQAGLQKTARQIEEDGGLERALRLLALRLGIKGDEVRDGVQNESVTEAFDPGSDEFMTAIVQLVEALGIPGDVLERRKPQVVKALRQRKLELRNRAAILTQIRRLMNVIDNNVAKDGKGDAE
jgi:hypothetical protein